MSKQHTISCHCGNISITAALPEQLTVCNCSICSRYQSLWGYFPPDEVAIKIEDQGASGYQCNDKVIEFIHCNHCGCMTHYQTLPGDRKPIVAINFRMLENEKVEGIPIRHFNGRDSF